MNNVSSNHQEPIGVLRINQALIPYEKAHLSTKANLREKR